MDNPRVAVVIEDDQDIRELVQAVLEQSGFQVHAQGNGADGVETVRAVNPTIVMLDLGLPDIDGFEVARRIRLFSDTYIIMLTARAEEVDTLLGLESGADDYVTKPFRPRELRARISAMLRRPRHGSEPVPGTAPEAAAPLPSSPEAAGTVLAADAVRAAPELVHGGLQVDNGTRTAALDGAELELTRTEFDLLHALMEGGKLVRSKAELVRRLRGEDRDAGSYISDADERTIEVHMANLRRKLGDDPRAPRWIKTVRGVGYQRAY